MEQDFFVGYYDAGAKQRALSRMLRKLQPHVLPSTSYFESYLQTLHRRDVSVHTLRATFSAIQGFLIFLQRRGKDSLSSLTVEDLEAFVEYEQDRGQRPVSVKGRVRLIYTFLKYLLEREIIPAEILVRKIRIKVPDALPRAMAPEDVKKLLGVIRKVRDRAMILVLLRTGMRIGELLRTRVVDVHLKERKIQLIVGEKNRTGRVVYLSEDAGRALQEWMKTMDPGKPLLFYGQGRSSLSYTTARMIFQRCLGEAGVLDRGYSLHGLRHTCATELLNAGMRLECLQQLLGHSNLEQTRRYARLSDKTREEEYFRAMARIEGREPHDSRDISGGVPPVLKKAQLLTPYDQNLYEHIRAFPAVVVGTGDGSDTGSDLGVHRLSPTAGVDPQND